MNKRHYTLIVNGINLKKVVISIRYYKIEPREMVIFCKKVIRKIKQQQT